VWGEWDPTFLYSVGRRALGGPAERRRLGGVAAGPDLTYVAEAAHNGSSSRPLGSLLAKWGAGEGNGASGSRRASTILRPWPVDGPATLWWPDTGNDRLVKLSRPAAC